MAIDPILRITDGTDTVNLIATLNGVGLVNWTPAVVQLKGGGVFQSSPIADGRSLKMALFDNVIETFNLTVHGPSQDAIFAEVRELRTLLTKARDYWTSSWQDEPVWIEARGSTETLVRYAIVRDWSTPQDDNPFAQPLFHCTSPLLNNFTLLVERSPFWTNQSPGSDTDILTGITQTYDGRTLGNVDDAGVADPTADAEVFFINHHAIAQLTDIYEDDGGVWSANLLDAGLPHRLLPAVTVLDDAIYFGIDTAVADSGPFGSLILDIGTSVIGETVVWEYWNGAAWVVFPTAGCWYHLADNTMGLTQSGVNSLYWDHPSDWATRALNLDGGPAITGWWIRARASVGGGTGGTQQNRDVYTVNWPYIEFQSDQIGGDVPALLKGILRNESNYDDDVCYQKWWNIMTMGLRGVDRGPSFTAYLPLADTQWPTGVTTAVEGGGITTFVDDVQYSPRGRSLNYAPVAPIAAMSDIWSVTLDFTVADQYRGRFQVYVRYHGGSNDEYAWQLTVRAGQPNRWVSEIINVTSSTDVRALYFGTLTFPPANVAKAEGVEEIELMLRGTAVLGGLNNVEFIDVILLPADEWLGTFYRDYGAGGGQLDGLNYLEIDSVTAPKSQLYTPKKSRARGYVESIFNHINVGAFQANTNQRMRLWTMGQDYRPLGGLNYCPAFTGGTLQLSMAQRYFSAIGGEL